jgi:hypothetical protein
MMITWPDLYYHTSQDRADKCDPTELKRASVIAAAGAYTIASADRSMAMKIANELVANASARIGAQLARATELLSDPTAENFNEKYNLGREYISAATINEKAALASVNELDKTIGTFTSENSKVVDAIGKSALASFDLYMKAAADEAGLKPATVASGKLISQASGMVPAKTAKVTEGAYGISRQLSGEIAKYADKYPVKGRPDMTELIRLCNGTNSVYEIKMLLDAQMMNGETDLQSLINAITILNESGYVTI